MRMFANAIAIVTAMLLIASGVWMLAEPLGWFGATPIVWRTGVPNAHFIRDVGWTYLFIGTLLFAGLAVVRWRRAALVTSLVWLGGHAAIHVFEAATGVCSTRQFINEVPLVLGPCLLLGLALALDYARGKDSRA